MRFAAVLGLHKIGWLHQHAVRQFGRRMRERLRANKRQRQTNDCWASLKILTQVSQLKIAHGPAGSLYGRNTFEDAEARARILTFKYGLGPPIFWQVTLSMFGGGRPIVTAAPAAWRAGFKDRGIRVAPVRSFIAWQIRQIRYLAHSLRVAQQMASFSWANPQLVPKGPYWIADRFPEASLPTDNARSSDYRLIPFIARALGDGGPAGAVWAPSPIASGERLGGRILVAPQVFPPLASRFAAIGFFCESLVAIGACTLRWLSGSAEAPALAKEVVELRYFNRLPSSRLPLWYIVTNSGCGARPLWIAAAEERGVKTAMVFYSINNHVIQTQDEPLPPPYNPEHRMMNWSRYLVRDSYQADWIRRVARGNPEVVEIGNIPLSDNGEDLPDLPANAVSVFDVTPLRVSYYGLYGERSGIYTDEYATAFLEDISRVIAKLGLTMALKLKRERPSRLIGPKYRGAIERLARAPHVIKVDPEIAAVRVMEKTRVTISIPFSSTGPSATMMDHPSAYYDPSGRVKADGSQNHGVTVLRGEAALEAWLLNVMTANTTVKATSN